MRRRVLACVLAALLVMAALFGCSRGGETGEGGGSGAPPARDDTPYISVLNGYAQGLAGKDYAALYALTDAPVTGLITEEDFVTRHKNIYGGIEADDITVDITDMQPIGPPEAAGEADAAITEGRRIHYRTSMSTAAGDVAFDNYADIYAYPSEGASQYLLHWDTHVIFPNLAADDKVRVATETGARGAIYDRNGLMLAGTGVVKSVGLVPGKLSEENREEDLAAVAELMGMSVETVNTRLSASWVREDVFVPLKAIPESDVARKEALLQIPGVRIVDEEDRVYPYGAAAAHLTGYVQSINKEELDARPGQGYTAQSKLGKVGLESLLEERIRGIDGCKIYIMDTNGYTKETLAERPVRHGEDVYLTIDAALQALLYEQLRDDKSAIVVMNPKTGEVLALMSTPAYDPNAFVLGVGSAQWEQWRDDERKPMYNRFKSAVVPGSVMKPVIAAIGLTGGAFTAEEDFGRLGRSWQKDSAWGSYTVTTLKDGGDHVTLERALTYSDNIYFAQAALKIGAEPLALALERAGFGQDVPFPFGLSHSSFGNNHVIESDIELADSGHGQGRVLVNPVHMASLYTAFLNDGDMLAPYLERREVGSPDVWIRGAFSVDAAHTVLDGLAQVINDREGTAYEARVPGVSLAGKTGTAEIKASKDDITGTEIGWFAAFTTDAPDERALLFVGMVEDVKGRGGSHYLFPFAQSVFER